MCRSGSASDKAGVDCAHATLRILRCCFPHDGPKLSRTSLRAASGIGCPWRGPCCDIAPPLPSSIYVGSGLHTKSPPCSAELGQNSRPCPAFAIPSSSRSTCRAWQSLDSRVALRDFVGKLHLQGTTRLGSCKAVAELLRKVLGSLAWAMWASRRPQPRGQWAADLCKACGREAPKRALAPHCPKRYPCEWEGEGVGLGGGAGVGGTFSCHSSQGCLGTPVVLPIAWDWHVWSMAPHDQAVGG